MRRRGLECWIRAADTGEALPQFDATFLASMHPDADTVLHVLDPLQSLAQQLEGEIDLHVDGDIRKRGSGSATCEAPSSTPVQGRSAFSSFGWSPGTQWQARNALHEGERGALHEVNLYDRQHGSFSLPSLCFKRHVETQRRLTSKTGNANAHFQRHLSSILTQRTGCSGSRIMTPTVLVDTLLRGKMSRYANSATKSHHGTNGI